jgi:hypothetical protein
LVCVSWSGSEGRCATDCHSGLQSGCATAETCVPLSDGGLRGVCSSDGAVQAQAIAPQTVQTANTAARVVSLPAVVPAADWSASPPADGVVGGCSSGRAGNPSAAFVSLSGLALGTVWAARARRRRKAVKGTAPG